MAEKVDLEDEGLGAPGAEKFGHSYCVKPDAGVVSGGAFLRIADEYPEEVDLGSVHVSPP